MSVILKPVTNLDYEFLYELLKERKPEILISFKMPTMEEHIEFWESQPYREAYIIYENTPKGFIYYSKTNEVGVFIEEISQGLGFGSSALKLLLVMHKGEKMLANINPKNLASIEFFIGLGFKHIQNTYEITNSG